MFDRVMVWSVRRHSNEIDSLHDAAFLKLFFNLLAFMEGCIVTDSSKIALNSFGFVLWFLAHNNRGIYIAVIN